MNQNKINLPGAQFRKHRKVEEEKKEQPRAPPVSPAAEDGCGCTVSSYRPAQQAPPPLPLQLNWLRPNRCFQPACFLNDVESDWSPIHDAAFNGRVLALQRLITQGKCVNLNTLDQVSPLHGACVQGHEACAKLLIDNGADVNRLTVDGKSPLTEACARGHVTCVALLLQHGATPVGTSHSSSPIHRAAAKGHPECIAPLVQHGADVDQYIEQLGSPLHVACSNRHPGAVRKLLQLGAGVNHSASGDSPLHIAARLSDPELVSLLLDHGADRSLRNPEGKRPLDLAPPSSPAERLLRQAGDVPPLMQMCRLNIRRAVGKRRLGGIHDLHLPTELKHFLLYH